MEPSPKRFRYVECDLTQGVPPHVFLAPVQFVMLSNMWRSIGMGFDLALYHDEEKAVMYWLLAQVYEEHRILADKFVESPGLVCMRHFVQARKHICLAYSLLFLLKHDGGDTDYARAVFRSRVKWLKRPAWCAKARLRLVSTQEAQDVHQLWQDWRTFASLSAVRTSTSHESVDLHTDTTTLRVLLLQQLQAATRHSRELIKLRVHDPWIALSRREQCALDQELFNISVSLSAWIRQHTSLPSLSTWTPTKHPWFPAPMELSLYHGTDVA